MRLKERLSKVKSRFLAFKEIISIYFCRIWKKIYSWRKSASLLYNKYACQSSLLIAVILCSVSFYILPFISSFIRLQEVFDDQSVNLTKTTLSNIGVCLIGVSIIAFTLAMFGIQQTSEKLPYTFFQQIHRSKSVFLFFFSLILLAIAISVFPVFIKSENLLFFLLIVFWLVVAYSIVIVLTYQRTISIISPIANLDELYRSTEKKFYFWRKYFKRTVPKEAYRYFNSETKSPQNYLQDLPETKESLSHLFFIAQKYSYSGDLAISDYALNTILIKMNELYIREKAGEFYVDTLIEKHPLSNDTYINNSLEKLRQTLEIALAKNDDEFAIQVLRSFYRLIDCYGNIAYRNDSLNSKPHAYMALYYLCQGVSLASTQKRIEVVLNGVRLIGAATRTLLEKSNLNNIEKGLGAIEEITINCLATKETWPVVQVGVAELAQLSKSLIKSKHHSIQDSAQSIQESLGVIFMGIIKLPEKNIHAQLLDPYFSLSEPNSLSSFLNSLLTNLLTEKDQDRIERDIKNIQLWLLPGGNYKHTMALIHTAIETRSSFTVSLIFWIVAVFKIAIGLSQLKLDKPEGRFASQLHITQQQLRNKAIKLLCIFNQLNVTKDTAYFLEQCHLTMHLVDMVLYALQKEVASMDTAIEGLISWGSKIFNKPHSGECSILSNSYYP